MSWTCALLLLSSQLSGPCGWILEGSVILLELLGAAREEDTALITHCRDPYLLLCTVVIFTGFNCIGARTKACRKSILTMEKVATLNKSSRAPSVEECQAKGQSARVARVLGSSSMASSMFYFWAADMGHGLGADTGLHLRQVEE